MNTFDFAISLLQMYILKYYFKAWRQLAKEKTIDKYISITFTCLALATVIRFISTTIKCVTNYAIWITPGRMEEQAWHIRHGIFLKELMRSLSIASVFTRNIGIAFNLTRWFLLYIQNFSKETQKSSSSYLLVTLFTFVGEEVILGTGCILEL